MYNDEITPLRQKRPLRRFFKGAPKYKGCKKTPLIINFGAPLLFYTLDKAVFGQIERQYPKTLVLASLTLPFTKYFLFIGGAKIKIF